jgi:hypothetical protein
MNAKIEILNFERDERGSKLGTFDVKIIYTEEKWEIFRNVAVFSKENKKWISFPNVKRDEKWMPVYERNSRLKKDVIIEVLKALEEDYL